MNWLRHLFGKDADDGGTEIGAVSTALGQTGSDTHQKVNLNPVPVPLTNVEPHAGRPTLDLVDGLNSLAEYYRYVEAEAYDRSLKTMREHRDFRAEFLSRAEAVLVYQSDADGRILIQRAIEKETAAFAGAAPVTIDVAEGARSRDPVGYALLNLTAPLTFESLKGAYRKAALAHHPDVGGDGDTMRKVNDAYELFSAILRRQIAEESAMQPPLPTRDSAELFFQNVCYARFCALLDDLNVDAAFEAYRTLSISELGRQIRSWETVSRMSELLAACLRPDDAKHVLHDLGTLVQDGEARGLLLQTVYRKTSEACCDPASIRFIPNHVRQADNLLRLGVIDKKRYDAVVKRIGDATIKIAEDESAFETFAKSYRFLQLPMDRSVPSQPPKGLVPAPDYYARVETLSESQRAEYALAFHGGAVELTLKYMAVRMDALLRAPFLGYVDINAVLAELSKLEDAPGMSSGLRALCGEALKIVSFLVSLPGTDRAKRITALKSLDANPGPLTITISIDGPERNGSFVLPRSIMMNPSYTAFATGPIERIKRYIETGSELTPAEQAEQRKNWEETRAFHDSDVYQRAREASWKNKDPDEIVVAVSALCEAMYDRAAYAHDRSLEIGYWTDKLTIALVKLKRFEEAFRWIQRYDDTPESVKGRDATGVLEALKKRKARCESFLRR